jgi:hypothetical protein
MTLRSPDTSQRETRDGARMKTRTALFLSASMFACSAPEAAPPPPETRATTPSALEAAHEAYLKSDWLTMNDRLHDVLVDRTTSPLVKENAVELLDKAYEATNGKLRRGSRSRPASRRSPSVRCAASTSGRPTGRSSFT